MGLLVDTWSRGAWVLFCTLLSFAIARRALKKKSLNKSGAVAAFFVGLVTITSHALFGALLLTFFISSSVISKLGSKAKAAVFADFKEGGQRDKWQVLANAAWVLLLACAWNARFGISSALSWPVLDVAAEGAATASGVVIAAFILLQGVIAHFAACCGDTWASELGTVFAGIPRFILPPFDRVPKGTNGGVTAVGTVASGAGGAVVGIVAAAGMLLLPKVSITPASINTAAVLSSSALTSVSEAGQTLTACAELLGLTASSQGAWGAALVCVATGLLAGLGGSVVDSLLGATMQVTVVMEDGRVSDELLPAAAAEPSSSSSTPAVTDEDTHKGRSVVSRKGAGKRVSKAVATPSPVATAATAASPKASKGVHIAGLPILGNSQVNSLAALAAVIAAISLTGIFVVSSADQSVSWGAAATAALRAAIAPLDLVAVLVACAGVVVMVRHEGDEEREKKLEAQE